MEADKFLPMPISPLAEEPKLEDVKLLSEAEQYYLPEDAPEVYGPTDYSEGYSLYETDPFIHHFVGNYPSREEAEKAGRERATVRVRTYESPGFREDIVAVREATPKEKKELWLGESPRLGFAIRGKEKAEAIVAKFPEEHVKPSHQFSPAGSYVEEQSPITLAHELGHLRDNPIILSDYVGRGDLNDIYEEFAATYWALARAKSPYVKRGLESDIDIIKRRAKNEGWKDNIIKRLDDLAKKESGLKEGAIRIRPKEERPFPEMKRLVKR